MTRDRSPRCGWGDGPVDPTEERPVAFDVAACSRDCFDALCWLLDGEPIANVEARYPRPAPRLSGPGSPRASEGAAGEREGDPVTRGETITTDEEE